MNSAVMIRFLALPSFLALLALTAVAEPADFRPGDKSPPGPPPNGGPPRGGDRSPFDGKGGGDRDRGDRGDRERGDWRGGGGGGSGIPGFGRPPGRNDGFDKLPEFEKKRVREALDKVWSRPEVLEARDRAMKANEDFRDAVRAALKAIDPEAVAIMDRVRPPDHFDPRQLPKLPPPESDDFPRIALERMGLELQAYARPERREELKRVHERILALPRLKEAISQVQSAQGEARIAAIQTLRDIYRDEVGKEFQAARERRNATDKARDKDKERDQPPGKDRDKEKPGAPGV